MRIMRAYVACVQCPSSSRTAGKIKQRNRTPPHPPTPPHQRTALAREHKKEKTTGAFAWTSSPLHPPNRAEREMQVQAGMCRKSRVGKNTVKTDAECDTHRKIPTKTMRNAEVNTFLHSAARRLGHFFAIKHRKNRCESNSKVQFRVPAKESHHPARWQTQRLPTTTTTTTRTRRNKHPRRPIV